MKGYRMLLKNYLKSFNDNETITLISSQTSTSTSTVKNFKRVLEIEFNQYEGAWVYAKDNVLENNIIYIKY